MNLLQFLLILKARYKVILVTFLITVLTAIIVTLLLPRSYSATTSLLLNYKGMDPVTGMVLPAQLMPGYMATQSDIINSRNIALKVVDQLGLAKSEQAQEQFQESGKGKGDINNWLADLLLKKLDVKPAKESSLISITFTSVEPNFAAVVANSFAENYQQTSVQLKIEPAQKAAGYFGQQIKTLRDNLEQAQTRLSKYQEDKGITNPEQSLDVESMRLNELSTQLSLIQASSIDAQSRQSAMRKNASDSPDVAINPIVQTLRIDAARAETKLAELSQRLSPNHPQYQAAETELAKIKSQLQLEISRASNSISSTASINQQREAELRAQVELQKKRVLELNRTRDEMTVMKKDVETAQRAMDAVTQRFSQTSIEGQSNQSDIAILNPAIPPGSPSSPRVLLNIAFAIVMGTILGIGFGFVAELADRRVRSKEDIANILEVPVFAVIEATSRKKPQSLLANQMQKLLPAN
ncbi:MAG: chain length determinant protein EpsF [Methylophilaceae bacterium]